jgi:hypothetical protein
MFEVLDDTGFVRGKFTSLDDAMEAAKLIDEFVIIKSADFELCGMFGASIVEDGILPDGTNYEWKKRRI